MDEKIREVMKECEKLSPKQTEALLNFLRYANKDK